MLNSISNIQRILQIIAILHIVAGLLFPWIVASHGFDAYRHHVQLVFDAEGYGAEQQAEFLMAIFGPTIASWGVLFLYAVNSAFSRPSPQAWWFMLTACLVWAPYDSVYSLQQGVYLNAYINAVAFVAMMVPLLVAKKHFFTKS